MKEKELLTKIDSIIKLKTSNVNGLDLEIEKFQAKVDSIEKSVQKFEIAQGYFSDIINFQLVTYVLIVSTIGLISWGGVVLYLKKRIQRQRVSFDRLIRKQERDFEKSKKELVEDINKVKRQASFAELQVLKAMYFHCSDSKIKNGALLWAIRIINFHIDYPSYEEEKDENKISWLQFGIFAITTGLTKEQLNKDNLKEIENVIAKCSSFEGEEVLNKLAEFKRSFYKLVYS
ncbi:MAG: hypothetical protein AB7O73_14005 [Bacteroidia bacterium]